MSFNIFRGEECIPCLDATTTRVGLYARNAIGDIALHLSVRQGCIAVIEVLLEHGASADVPNKFGLTPLHVAAMEGHHLIVKLPLSKDANPNQIVLL